MSIDPRDPATLFSQRTYMRVDSKADGRVNDDGSVEVRSGETDLTIAGSTWDLFTAIDDPTRAWAGTTEDGDALLIAAVDGEEPFVVGTCMADTYTPYLRSAFAALGARNADDDIALLDEAVSRGASSRLVSWFAGRVRAAEAARAEATLPWAERDPRARSIAPPDAPAEVRSHLVRFPLAVERPERWSEGEPTTICPFLVDTGWGDCYALSGAGVDALAGASIEAIPGTPIELWVLDDAANFASPVRRLATLGPGLVDELVAAHGSRTLVIELDGGSPGDATASVSTRTTR